MRPDLSDVTLVAVTSIAVDATVRALQTSMSRARFGRVILLTDSEPPPTGDGGIEWRRIAPIESRGDYSRFMLRELAEHIDTGHALCVQWDGFVLNGDSWDREFLQYDYIGAVWPQFTDGKNIGNGGFSLRSRRLLQACNSLRFDGSEPEDVIIGRTCRDALEAGGIRFAPDRLAHKFSFERTPPTGQEFGFHGAFNLVRYLAPAEAVDVFRTLEPGVLTRGEHLELLGWALKRGRLGLASAVALRLHRKHAISL